MFVYGITGDGEVDWNPMLPAVAERFSCYLMSTRGRGLSADHPSHSREVVLQDVVSFVESVGESVGLIGFSSGGGYALRAAAECPTVAAVAVYEPALVDVLTPEEGALFREAVGRAGEAISDGKFAEAIQEFTTDCVATDDEVASLSSTGYYEAAAPNAPGLMQDITHGMQSELRMGEPSALAQIKQPTLLLHGTASAMGWFADVAEHAAAHIPDIRVREIPGAAHFAPILEPEPVAEELVGFFEEVLPAS